MQRRFVFALGVLALAGTTQAAAQVAGGAIRVGPRLGADVYAEKTGIKTGPMLGLDATYYLSSNFGFGAYIDFSRPETDGTFFPAELNFGNDSTLIYAVSQPLTVLKYGAQLVGTTAVGRLEPYLLVGIGAYQIQLDPQVNAANRSITELQYTVGVGVDIGVSRNAVIRLDARDYILTKFDRENLYATDPRFRPVRFPEVLPAQEDFSGSTSNFVFALSFQFTPGGAR